MDKKKKLTGFIEIKRKDAPYRSVDERLKDWGEIPQPLNDGEVREQAARCMDCGIPFCHQGCPLGNLIPEWNDFVFEGRWKEALNALLATNNFPEFTGRVCPAPCEHTCVLGINEDPVSIKQIEVSIIDKAFAEGWITPNPPKVRTGKKVAIIGSGPAGLACAEQLNRAGHHVVVFEKADRIGGLLIYGIPDFKMDKPVLERRLKLMEAEGIEFRANSHVGVTVPVEELQQDYDAIVLCTGAEHPRPLNIPGEDLDGVVLAMDFLTQQNRRNLGDDLSGEKEIFATGKTVIIIGGGDTGSDCLGTSLRQEAKEVLQFEHKPQPPKNRPSHNLWPEPPLVWTKSTSHEEGGVQEFSMSTRRFEGEDGKLKRLHAVKVEIEYTADGNRIFKEVPGSEFAIETELVLVSAGFTGPVQTDIITQLGIQLNRKNCIAVDENKMTNIEGVFAAGDNVRGQSLVVWAIAEGRDVARGVDQYLTGKVRLPTAHTAKTLAQV